METCLVPATLRSISHLPPAQDTVENKKITIYKYESHGGTELHVIISHRSSGPLLDSGAPQDKRTEVGVSE